jgi:hypothetical protein
MEMKMTMKSTLTSAIVTLGIAATTVGPERKRIMAKTTTAAAAAMLLLGASVAMAQEEPTFPPLVVLGVETTANVVVQPAIAVGDLCVDALQALRAVPLPLSEVTVIQGGIMVFVMSGQRREGAILTCAQGLTDILPPAPPPPPSPANRG